MGVKCCMPATDALGRKPSELAGTELPTFGVDELSNAIVSTMRIELRIRCEGLPSSFLAQEKSLLYKVELGNGQQVLKWSQKLETNSESRFSNAYILPYEMGTNNDIKASLYSFEGGKESDSRVLYGTATMSLDEAILAQDNTVRSKVAVVDKAHAEEETYVALQVGDCLLYTSPSPRD
eukprot:TRINITY_DN1214_c0_g1_i2.p2 TRINITY_DN1214_c0_g1~~TRINITY_DN1214_c0_g1_i2.p2  ORF type:complete len:179 (-),score=41.35 TRINITY_DN1214_c0_g1_i2:53-589(-)